MSTTQQLDPAQITPEPEQFEVTENVIVDPELFAKIRKNKSTRQLILWVGISVLAILGFLLWSIVQQALGSETYQYVVDKQSLYDTVGYIVAAISGVFVAAYAAFPVQADFLPEDQQPKDAKLARKARLKPVDGLMLFGAFIIGTVPGLVLMFIIRYPLSSHACRLSGSKYC
jgi:amino acid transporter